MTRGVTGKPVSQGSLLVLGRHRAELSSPEAGKFLHRTQKAHLARTSSRPLCHSDHPLQRC